MAKKSSAPAKRRIFELDLLRGFFIFVIIIDHLQFWPSPWGFVTGEGRLWVSAAEGFFLISGLLIGYIRAYKGKKYSLGYLTKLLWKRAAVLYVWGVGVTFFVVGLTFLFNNHPLLPVAPDGNLLSTPLRYIGAVLSGEYFNSWIYFLRLYAIMLLATPLLLFLLRKGQDLLAIAIILSAYLLGFWLPEAALQWQLLFFGAAIIGYRLEQIIAFFQKRPLQRRILAWSMISFSIITIAISGFFTVGWGLIETPGFFFDRTLYEGIRIWLDPWFANSPMQIGRMSLAFIWFISGLLFLNIFKQYFMKWLGWLLIPLGERSLTAYILQALLLPFVVVAIPLSENMWANGFIGVLCVMLIWWLMRLPVVRKLIPS